MEYYLDEDLSEEERMVELELNLLRGNHQSAKKQPEKLSEKINGDVTFGFAIPIWKKYVK